MFARIECLVEALFHFEATANIIDACKSPLSSVAQNDNNTTAQLMLQREPIHIRGITMYRVRSILVPVMTGCAQSAVKRIKRLSGEGSDLHAPTYISPLDSMVIKRDEFSSTKISRSSISV